MEAGKEVKMQIEKQSIKKEDLINIADALGYLASKETTAWYQVGKNLRLVKSFMEEVESTRTDIKKNCALHDDKGMIVTKEVNGVNVIVWKDAESEQEQDKLWKEFINEDAPEIEFHKFSIDKLDGVELNAGLLSNLIDTVII